MAEEEKIREHAKQALQGLTDKKKGWREKTKDFLWEVFIIIVAVNVTLWFHNWSDKRHDRELEKNFLIGTRNDLSMVKQTLKDNYSGFYQPTLDYYDSVWVQMNEHRIDKAFVDTNSYILANTSYFTYDNSRFENFKSSGYLRLIENDSLSMYITNLYSVTLPWIASADKMVFDGRWRDFCTYIGSKMPIDSSGGWIVSSMLNAPGVKFHIQSQRDVLESSVRQQQETLQAVEGVITLIDEELKTRFNYEAK